MNKVEFEEMIKNADRRMQYSELEKEKIKYLLEYCHASGVRYTFRRTYEVFYMCDAMSGMELTLDSCSSGCEKYGCSNCTAAEDAELLINREKTIFEVEPSDEFCFKDEVKSILNRYRGDKKEKVSDGEIDMIVKKVKKELRSLNNCLGE